MVPAFAGLKVLPPKDSEPFVNGNVLNFDAHTYQVVLKLIMTVLASGKRASLKHFLQIYPYS